MNGWVRRELTWIFFAWSKKMVRPLTSKHKRGSGPAFRVPDSADRTHTKIPDPEPQHRVKSLPLSNESSLKTSHLDSFALWSTNAIYYENVFIYVCFKLSYLLISYRNILKYLKFRHISRFYSMVNLLEINWCIFNSLNLTFKKIVKNASWLFQHFCCIKISLLMRMSWGKWCDVICCFTFQFKNIMFLYSNSLITRTHVLRVHFILRCSWHTLLAGIIFLWIA